MDLLLDLEKLSKWEKQLFDAIDTDHSGTINLKEIIAYAEAMAKKKGIKLPSGWK